LDSRASNSFTLAEHSTTLRNPELWALFACRPDTLLGLTHRSNAEVADAWQSPWSVTQPLNAWADWD